MPLYQESGGSPTDRKAEAYRIVTRLSKVNAQLTEKEEAFIGNVEDRLENPNGDVSPRQIFWLRDILEKYNA